MQLPYHPAIQLLVIYSREINVYIHTRHVCTNVYGIFIIISQTKNPNGLEEVNDCSYHRILFSNKENAMLMYATTWINSREIYCVGEAHLERLHTV
jgi:hypothetical protein